MAFFNFFSHGTQDLYPTFLKMQHGFDPHLISIIAIFITLPPCSAVFSTVRYRNVLGVKSDHDRRLSCASGTPAMGIFQRIIHDWSGRVLMQFMVQGARGVVPTRLNELVPANARAVLRGLFTNSVIYWRRLMRRYRPASRKRMVAITGWQWRSWLARWLF